MDSKLSLQTYDEIPLKTQKKKNINEALIEMVDGLITSTEPFLRHETFTSQPGGFSLVVNGIEIHTKEVIFK